MGQYLLDRFKPPNCDVLLIAKTETDKVQDHFCEKSPRGPKADPIQTDIEN
jgi:hypothetical protein